MVKVTPISSRKSDHIRINLEQDVDSAISTGLERYRFPHRAIPEINFEAIDMSLDLFGKRLHAPILISSMTGGTAEAFELNNTLAEAAQLSGIAMGLGSQRAGIEHPELAYTFQVRQKAPDILLFANLGAVQLNYGYDIEQCKRVVDMVEADALILHFNALQEAVQPGGDTRFAGLLKKVEKICTSLDVPVIAKEVGWGFSDQDALALSRVGVAAIDVAGAGGTSWAQVEMHRAENSSQARLAAAFSDWGIPTSQSILNVRSATPELMIFASGGLRTGVDIAKCIALGATLGGMAGPFLKAAASSLQDTLRVIEEVIREIQVCMFATGAADLESLRGMELIAL